MTMPLTISQANDFIIQMAKKRQGYAKSAVAYYFKMIGQPVDAEWIKKNLKSVRALKPKRQVYPVGYDELQSMRPYFLREFHYHVAMLQYLTAARAGEILGIKKQNVTVFEDRIVIRLQGKGGKHRNVYLHKKHEWLLQGYMHKPKESLLFINAEDNVMRDTVYKRYLEDIENAAEKAGVKISGTHDLRRGAAAHLQAMKVPTEDIRAILGHSQISTTERYLRRDDVTTEAVMLRYQER